MQVFKARLARNESRGIAYLATRFAAKEAFSKAIGLGMRSPMSWRVMQTLNDPSGKPVIKCSGKLQTFMEEKFYTAQVSITDEVDMAMAFVIVIYGTPVVTGVTDPKDLMGS
jgi:holo-[acyl-carrier protein] synthase